MSLVVAEAGQRVVVLEIVLQHRQMVVDTVAGKVIIPLVLRQQ